MASYFTARSCPSIQDSSKWSQYYSRRTSIDESWSHGMMNPSTDLEIMNGIREIANGESGGHTECPGELFKPMSPNIIPQPYWEWKRYEQRGKYRTYL